MTMGFAEIFLEDQVAFGDHDQPAVIRVRAFDRVVGLFEAIEVNPRQGAGLRGVLGRPPAPLGVGRREVVGGTRRKGEEGEGDDEFHGVWSIEYGV